MALRFTTSTDEAHIHGVKMLVYGRSGFGKTTLLATAPRPLIISCESGLLSLAPKTLRKVLGRDVGDIPTIIIETADDLEEALAFVSDPTNAEVCDTVCLDSVTEIGERVLSSAKAMSRDPRQAYGEMQERLTAILKSFRDLPGKHVVFVAKEQKNSESAATLYGPAMPGNRMSEALPYLFDEVFHLGIGELEDGTKYRFLQTSPDYQFDAKDRSGALESLEQPDLTQVISKIKNHVR